MSDLQVTNVAGTSPAGGIQTPPKKGSGDTRTGAAVSPADQATVKTPATGSVPATGALPASQTQEQAREARARGIAAYRRGDYRAAEQYLRKSVELFTALANSANPAPETLVEWISTLSDLGRTLYNIKDVPADLRQRNIDVVSALYQQASEAFQELAALPQLKNHPPLYTGIMGLNLNVAQAYRDQGDLEEAENLLKANISLAGKLGNMPELSLSVSQTNLQLALIYAAKGDTARQNRDAATARAQFRASQKVLGQVEQMTRAPAAGGGDWEVHSAVLHQRQAYNALRLAQLDGAASPKGQEGLKEARRLAEQALAGFRKNGPPESIQATRQLLDEVGKTGR